MDGYLNRYMDRLDDEYAAHMAAPCRVETKVLSAGRHFIKLYRHDGRLFAKAVHPSESMARVLVICNMMTQEAKAGHEVQS